MEEKEKEEGDVVIIDIGTGTIKAGWAGEDAPRCVIPSMLMKCTQTNLDRTGGEPTVEVQTLIGHDALQVPCRVSCVVCRVLCACRRWGMELKRAMVCLLDCLIR